MKTGLSLTTCRQLTRIFLETMLDCIASDGWVDFTRLGRFKLKKRMPFKAKVFGKDVVIDPAPRIILKLRKPSFQYLKDKMSSYGTTWEMLNQKGQIAKNPHPNIKVWLEKKGKEEELKLKP
jgi:nucleoid DNA-binding protein